MSEIEVKAPERIRVAQDEDGFWTCREAVSGSQVYVRADIYDAALVERKAEPVAFIVHDPENGDYLTKSRVAAERSEYGFTPLYSTPVTVGDGADGLARLKDQSFDLLLSDIRNALIGNLLDRWEMTPNDLKEEMREHGCGKQLDALSAAKE